MSYEPNYLAYAHRIRNADDRVEMVHQAMQELSQEDFVSLLDIMVPVKEN